MYEEYWGFQEKPFINTPDPKYFYYSKQHHQALTRLFYAVSESKGAMLLTGDYGCGKTLLSRAFVGGLDKKRYEICLITNPNLTAEEFLKETLYQFGVDTDAENKLDLLHLLNDFVYTQKSNGKSCIIVIDEAQAVTDPNTLEEIRLLLNFQKNEEFLVTLVLMGQPELKDSIESLPQLKQRLGIRFHLSPLEYDESKAYIEHRLKVAGAEREIFTTDSIKKIFDVTKGIPRVINNVCDLALLVGSSLKSNKVEKAHIDSVAADLGEV